MKTQKSIHRHYKLLLASQSPRRLDLLQSAGYFCEVDSVKISEIFDKNLNKAMAVEQIAEDKVRALVGQRKALKGQGYLILGADTAVFCGDRFLGKPKNEVEAEEFLRLLSGREHEIITGVFILDLDLDQAFRGHEMSRVQFKSLSEKEIRDYIALGEGFDKAGGYGIQGEARKFVIQQTGSWSNIVGLPMELFTRWVKDNGWVFLGHQNT